MSMISICVAGARNSIDRRLLILEHTVEFACECCIYSSGVGKQNTHNPVTVSRTGEYFPVRKALPISGTFYAAPALNSSRTQPEKYAEPEASPVCFKLA